jgi:transcriptional regulator NrdR family protein
VKCVQCDGVAEATLTRKHSVYTRRRRQCLKCGMKFDTYEVYWTLWGWVSRFMAAHAAAIEKRRERWLRNERIVERLRAGEKHVVVAAEFGLSDSMVSTVARRMGVPSRRTRGEQTLP